MRRTLIVLTGVGALIVSLFAGSLALNWQTPSVHAMSFLDSIPMVMHDGHVHHGDTGMMNGPSSDGMIGPAMHRLMRGDMTCEYADEVRHRAMHRMMHEQGEHQGHHMRGEIGQDCPFNGRNSE
jgi:hypothetical protein